MKLAVVAAVVEKEAREVLRDLRSVVLLTLLPALIYPALLFVAARLGEAGTRSLEAERLIVARADELPDDVAQALRALDGVELTPLGASGARPPDVTVRLKEGEAVGPLVGVAVEVDRASERGLAAERRVVPALVDARRQARDDRLRAQGIAPELIAVPSVDVIDRAPAEKKSGFLLSRAVVPILVLVILLGAYYPAIETTVGERERRTLRTLLCAPVDATSIALGKLLVVALLALTAALANLVGLVLTARIGLLEAQGFAIPLSSLGILALLFVPLSVVLAALLMATASLARTSREANTLLTPLTLVVTFPALAPSFPGIEATATKALVPLFGTALAAREVLGGTPSVELVVAALVGSAAFAAVAVLVAGRAFTVEALVTGRIQAPLRVDGALPPFDTGIFVVALAAVYLLLGASLRDEDPILTLVVVQVVTFVILPGALVALRARDPLFACGLVRPGPGTLALVGGALLCLPTFGAIGAWAATRIITPDELEAFRSLSERLEALPRPLLFALLALLPAVVEELTFRGVIQRALARRGPLVAVLGAAVCFSAFHGSWARVTPTLLLGTLAGVVAFGARSTWASMIVHASHNALALLLGLTIVDGGLASEADPYAALPLATHALVVPGLGLLVVGWRRARAAAAEARA